MNLSFVIIVLNGMPFLEYCLDAIYDIAHEIIIVEGAVENCMFAANPDGSSRDGSVECIKGYPDPGHKLRLFQGLWTEKVHMQNKALEQVTGDYVWLVDSDEIYKKEDLARIKALLENDGSISQVNFIPDNFWKGFDDIFISTMFFEKESHYRRLFKFLPGSRFTSHRPPTLYWPGSPLSTEEINLVGGETTRTMGIIIYHYSYVLEDQVRQKIELYRRYGWGNAWNIDMNQWFSECFLKWTPENKFALERAFPVWTGDRKSRTISFAGSHPEAMTQYIRSFKAARQPVREEEILPVIGGERYQKMVLDAWQFIELDAPLQLRRQTLRENTATGKSFWNNHVALAFLADRLQPRSYLEVGVRTGGSMVQVLAAANPGEVVAMDLWEGEYASLPNHVGYTRNQLQKFQERIGKASPLQFIHGDSHLELKELIRQGRSFDLVTIDGDHSLEGAREDLEDALRLLGPRGAIVFDDITHVAHKYLLGLVHEICRRFPYLGVLFNTSQDNGCAIFLKNIQWQELLAGTAPQKAKRIKIAGEHAQDQDLTKVATESDFARSIREIFSSIKPKKIIETGTYHGEGTTRVIASTLRDLGLAGAEFYSIECNPDNYARAVENLRQSGLSPFVKVLNGLSTPRSDLPSYQEIETRYVRNLDSIGFDDIFIDHQEQQRALLYFKETDFSNIPEDLLGACLRHFDFRPDFVLLDSGGHMGNIEFNLLIGGLRGPCFVALDDIYHIKHHLSFHQMQKDPRFRIVVSSKEKFGFCIAQFTPIELPAQEPKHILWVRPDSIGDTILACSMLPHIKAKFPGAKITVLCQERVSELYHCSPLVDAVIGFDPLRAYQEREYQDQLLDRVQGLRADLALNSLYSRAPLYDEFALRSGARERIALHGDLSNISAEARDANNGRYSRVIHSEGAQKPELERHRDFLKGLGIDAPRLEPTIWTSAEDECFADDFFRDNNLAPERCLALFAGAQFEYRVYTHYGRALAGLCREQNLSLISLGTEQERALSQENLDASGAHAVNLCGKLTLRQCTAILRRCRLAVGAETGTAHMACAVGTPNVILLGGGHFSRFMPYSPLTSVVCLPLECYGCNWECKFSRAHCVKDLNPLVITEAVRQTLRARSEKIRVFCEAPSLWLPLQEEPLWKECREFLNHYPVEIFYFDQTPPAANGPVFRRKEQASLAQLPL
jgi:ADP-heptose:LPS heptosyltransferase/predicted O-methyltransferase YrrM